MHPLGVGHLIPNALRAPAPSSGSPCRYHDHQVGPAAEKGEDFGAESRNVKREVVEAIISMAQQARPKVSGQMADSKRPVRTHSPPGANYGNSFKLADENAHGASPGSREWEYIHPRQGVKNAHLDFPQHL